MHRARYADAARRRETFQTGGDVYAIARDIVAFDDDIAKVDPDAELNAGLVRLFTLSRHHRFLDRQ